MNSILLENSVSSKSVLFWIADLKDKAIINGGKCTCLCETLFMVGNGRGPFGNSYFFNTLFLKVKWFVFN